MAYFTPKDINLSIPNFEISSENKITKYCIQVNINNVTWKVYHRYSDFADLHASLVSNHGIAKNLLPPKKLIGSKSIEFIRARQSALEEYIQV